MGVNREITILVIIDAAVDLFDGEFHCRGDVRGTHLRNDAINCMDFNFSGFCERKEEGGDEEHKSTKQLHIVFLF